MSISAPHVIFQVTLVPDKSCLPRMSKKLTQQGSMHMNSSGHAGLLVTSSWKIWLRDVMKTKQILAAIRGLRERIIHTNKAISQGSYKTVINPSHCSQINRMTAETGRNRQGIKLEKPGTAGSRVGEHRQEFPCGITDESVMSLSSSSQSHALIIVCPVQPPLQAPQWLLASYGGEFFLAGNHTRTLFTVINPGDTSGSFAY